MARACCAADNQGRIREYCGALFEAIFVENQDIDRRALEQIASGIGLTTQQFSDDFESLEVDKRVSTSAREALERGAFGVPTFFVDGRMYWGNDRLVLLEGYLKRRKNS